MALLAGISSFFDKYVLGYAIGTAAGPSLEPFVQDLANDAWKLNQVLPLPADVAAAIEAQAYTGTLDGAGDATETGINGDRYAALRFLASTAPGTAELLELWRRGKLTEAQVRAGLKKGGLLDEFVDAVLELFTGRLDPAVIATAIQRGIMADPGFLPVGPPTATGKVPAFPVSPLDPIAEAKAHGIDEARLFVETAIVGLPLSLQQAASAYFRGIIELADFERAVAEGNTRNEWGPPALEQARQIPTAHDGVEDHLRGWVDAASMYATTARHGMSKADTDLLFRITGRPLSFHQVFIGLRRGGVYDGPTTAIDPAFLKALRESNIRPEWYNLAWAQRFLYPTAFVLRSLTESGDITGQEAETILLYEGWEPTLAATVAAKWSGGTTAAADKNVTKAQTKAWTEAQSSYIAEESTAADVQPIFQILGVAPAAQTEIISTWDAIRALTRKQLSPAQIRKALGDGITNPATGVAWTTADATAALLARGYDAADAQVFLEE